MSFKSIKKKRKILAILLGCTGFMTGFSLDAIANDNETSVQSINQEKLTIKGTVSDSNGETIIGASIHEKGTTTGTITDIDGNFSLTAAAGSVIVISYIGYTTQEIVAEAGKTYRIVLQEDTEMLDEVVVIGYGSVQRKNFTGSVSRVEVADSPLSLMPTTSPLDALRGTTTGVNVSQQQGAGQNPSILIRGQKSVKGGTDPMIVLDGVIYMGAMRDIDPATIESISILKDATTAAAYGSRAANGVVMITTKKGKLGKPIVTFNASVGFSNMANKPDVLSPENYIRKMNRLNNKAEDDPDPTTWMTDFEKENYRNGITTDWLDYVSQTGVMQNYTATVSGATEKISYFLSASHSDQQGVLIGDDYDRQAITARLQADITSWLQIGGQTNVSYNDYSGVTNYNIYQAIRLSPYGRTTRPNGEIEKYPRQEGIYMTNPLWNIKSGTVDDHDTFSTYLVKGHALVKCPWINGLSYRFNGSYANEYVERDYFTHEGYFVPEGDSEDRYSSSTIAGYLSRANGYSARTKNTSWVMDHIVNFNRQFDQHFVDLTYVYTRDSKVYDYRRMDGENFAALGNTELGANGLVYATTHKISNIDRNKHNNIGYLGRISYNYADKYHFNASIRRDGSSVFGKDNKWGTFPSVGVAWTLSEETFMSNIESLDNLKLKVSWGKNGNQSISPYATLSGIALGQKGGYSYPFGNTSTVSWGQRNSSLGNTTLGWEETEAISYGFELAALKNRVRLDFDGYFSKTTDQIFDRVIPVMANGITSMKETMGRVDNWGIEIALNTTNIRNKDFEWNSNLTFYMNRNKLKELYGDGKDDIANSLFLGKSLGAIYGLKPIGIVQEDDTDYMAANGAVPGDIKFANIDGDEKGEITNDDRTILGYRKENFRMGFSNTLRYKDFELYALFTGIFGGNGYNREVNIYAYRTMSDVIVDNNFDHGWWTPENKSNKYPRINYTDGRYIPTQNKAFVRLQDLSLSYTFRQPWVKKIGMSNLKVYAAAKNLFTLTGWTGGDPEIAQTLGSGYDYGYPLATTYSFGVNVSF